MQSKSLTLHARQRLDQRGINALQIQLLNNFGVDHYQHGGTTLRRIPEKSIAALRQARDKISGKAIVIGDGERLITAMHQTKPIRCTEYCI